MTQDDGKTAPVDPIHPSDPLFLGLKLQQLRFEMEHGRQPTEEESLALVRKRLGCTHEEAQLVMASVKRTIELEAIAHDLMDKLLPDMLGGALSGYIRRP